MFYISRLGDTMGTLANECYGNTAGPQMLSNLMRCNEQALPPDVGIVGNDISLPPYHIVYLPDLDAPYHPHTSHGETLAVQLNLLPTRVRQNMARLQDHGINPLLAIAEAITYGEAISLGLDLNIPNRQQAERGLAWMKKHVEEHGSLSVGFSAAYGVAVDFEIGFSKKGISLYGGLGRGIGFNFSCGGAYDFQDISGITSETAINASLGGTPIQYGGSFMVSPTSETKIAASLHARPGLGFIIETTFGYSKTFSWQEVERLFLNAQGEHY